MKEYKRSGGIEPLILSLSARRRVVNVNPSPLYPRDGTPLTTKWTPELVWKFWRIENPFNL